MIGFPGTHAYTLVVVTPSIAPTYQVLLRMQNTSIHPKAIR